MHAVIETRLVKTGMGMKLKNICEGRNGKRIVYHADGYYYLNKDNSVSGTRYKD